MAACPGPQVLVGLLMTMGLEGTSSHGHSPALLRGGPPGTQQGKARGHHGSGSRGRGLSPLRGSEATSHASHRSLPHPGLPSGPLTWLGWDLNSFPR